MISTPSFSSDKINSQKNVEQRVLSNKDTITNKLIIEYPISLENNKGFDFWDNMPWLTASLIGAVTLYLGHRQLKSNERTLLAQINSAKDIARLDFSKTVISGNRQEWINKLQENLSEYIARIETYCIALDSITDDVHEIKKLANDNLADILKLEMRIVLMLNSDEDSSKELIRLLGLYVQCIFEIEISQPNDVIKQKILEITKKILKTEWERVKRGE